MSFVFALLVHCICLSAESINDWSCETALAVTPAGAREVYAKHVRVSPESALFLRIERPDKELKGWLLAIHGLLDGHDAWDRVTPLLLEKGYGVARPDLPGFARSLGDAFPFESGGVSHLKYVQLILRLVGVLSRDFGIDRPRLLGHSMGGGLVTELLGTPGIAREVGRTLIVNPYVYRSEFYEAEKMNPTLPSLSALDRWVPEVFKRYPQAYLDRFLDPYLQYHFTKYFRDLVKTRGVRMDEVSLREVAQIQVEIAIGVTKGLRPLDSRETIRAIPDELRLDMIYAREDDVVPAPLARKLAHLVERRGGRVKMVEGHHHTPLEHPEEVADMITD